ncbi:MAG: 30S ribosomal protein S16 [Bacteroidetes bacterium]|nr:MAG: 30S ribosomal protein S16 [Bacteroidota bacterium]
MPTRIRLQRKGKKGNPFYHVVIADGRAPRDGKFIERIGTYNPMTDPATIDLNFDRALYWLQVGAQPSETVRSIFSREGVLLKDHLLKGVKKGALTEDLVEEKFKAWLKEKAEKLEQTAKDAVLSVSDLKKKRLEEEKKINEARAEELAKKLAKDNLKAEEKAAPEAEEPKAEEPKAEEPKAEEPKAEEPKAEEPKAEEPKAEEPKAEEPKAEEPKAEEPKAEEPKAEEPKAEEPKAEAPDADAPAEEKKE